MGQSFRTERLSVAGPPFTDAIPYAQALIKVAPSRILWGDRLSASQRENTCQMTDTSWIFLV